MKIAFDARWMTGNYRGMGKYGHALVEPVRDRSVALLPARTAEVDGFATTRGGGSFFPWWEQAWLPRLAQEAAATHLLCPYNTGPLRVPTSMKLILVVHDLIYLESWRDLPPSVSAYQTLGRLYRRWNVPAMLARADHVISVSEYTRNEIVRRFDIDPARITVIPNSISDLWFEPTAASDTPPDRPYLLAVAGEAPSKNLPRLIEAFARLRHRGHDALELRIVGVSAAHHAHFMALAESKGAADAVRFEGFLSIEALRAMYCQATLFVMPSLYEGFGIPLLEAMASGAPVVCSRSTSLPEVAGEAGWFFDPRDVDAIATTLALALCDDAERQRRVHLGSERVIQYSNRNVRPQMADFWNRLSDV